jgi:IstB-like ATP binding protein
MSEQILQQLRILKLPGIREHLSKRLMEAEANDLSYTDFLSMLLSDEFDERTSRKINRMLCRSMFSVSYYSFHQLFSELASADIQNRLHSISRGSSRPISWSSTTSPSKPSISNLQNASMLLSTVASAPNPSSSLRIGP